MAQYSNGRERPRNAGPTPPDKPTPRNERRTPNPNAYESSADIVARRNAENARRNPIPRKGGRDGAQYFDRSPLPQMPTLPREGMSGLVPQSPNDIRTPFRAYPDFGSPQDPMVPEGLLGNAMAESSGTGRAVTPEEEMMLAYEIMKSLQMMQAEPQSGFEDEYRMDGTYAPYKLGPGNNSPQEPFWKGLWEGLKKADQSLYRPEMFGEYPESLK